ncbi:hypothetical protein [Roseateles sp.]|uniref:hypothetical protein n=1 Tax=Roseateles sp. TaxID=1971397 RepID=UPI0039EA0BBE
MELPAPSPEAQPHPSETAKAIGDLDSIVRALLTVLPPSKPWQRQLLAYLAEADRKLQILRMTIALGKDRHEIEEAADQLQVTLRAANLYVGGGRVDMGTKTAVQLAFSLGHRIAASLQARRYARF